MCRAFEEVREEGERRKAIEAAKRLLLGGKLSYEEIADAMGHPLKKSKLSIRSGLLDAVTSF